MITRFSELEKQVKDRTIKKVAVAMAQEGDVLTAINHAYQYGIVTPLLVGNAREIEEIAKQHDIDISSFTIVEAHSEEEAAQTSVNMVKNNEADLIMKGRVPTATLMRAILDKETGLASSGILSHVTIIEADRYGKMLFMSDPGLNIDPDLKTKVAMVNNVVAVAHQFGIEVPKVAVVSAVEKVNPAMQSSLDAAALSKMAERNQIRGCMIDGPFALDNAISKKSCEVKGIKTNVGGDADILLLPHIDAANIFYKAMANLTDFNMAGIIAGAERPIILTSRADKDTIKYYSILTGVALAASI
jgi:phosphate butyryltransferase